MVDSQVHVKQPDSQANTLGGYTSHSPHKLPRERAEERTPLDAQRRFTSLMADAWGVYLPSVGSRRLHRPWHTLLWTLASGFDSPPRSSNIEHQSSNIDRSCFFFFGGRSNIVGLRLQNPILKPDFFIISASTKIVHLSLWPGQNPGRAPGGSASSACNTGGPLYIYFFGATIQKLKNGMKWIREEM